MPEHFVRILAVLTLSTRNYFSCRANIDYRRLCLFDNGREVRQRDSLRADDLHGLQTTCDQHNTQHQC
jgi:hypothetical protein